MKFHNPYNFVRTPERNEEHAFAGDYDPVDKEDHSRYWPELYTGTIPVRLRTQTPLFITNPNSKREHPEANGHYIYDCLDYIPATALKGMLSSVYEIITNSRYRVFNDVQHKKRLGFRYQAEANLIPGRVTCEDGDWKVTLFKGTSAVEHDGRANRPLYAAWIPVYRNDGWTKVPTHGQWAANVKLRLYNHGNFQFWSVADNLPGAGDYRPVNNTPVAPQQTISADGYVVVTDKTFSRKHDERFFFNTQLPEIFPLNKDICKRYEELVEDYQRVHNGGANPPIGNVKHGRHITDPDEQKLQDGCFVYVKMEGGAVKALYPVQISRELYDVPPFSCLGESLHPAKERSQLSPADRLFGWVPQGGSEAWMGKIRISDGVFDKKTGDNAVTVLREPLPLTILGGPKPSQARFYLGDQQGNPQNDGITKTQAGYMEGKKLRGRKVYLHHNLSSLSKEVKAQYWNPNTGAGNTEYRQLVGKKERTSQNRSISGWIEPRKDFLFEIKVENLTAEELGAVLVLLNNLDQSQGQPCYFRLGYAKPLGLGSVRLSVALPDEALLPVVKGDAIARRYSDLKESGDMALLPRQCRQAVQSYQKAIADAYGQPGKSAENPPAGELCRWKALEFVKEDLLSAEDVAEFERVWNGSLERGDAGAPLDDLPFKETLMELYPELPKDLAAIYEEESANLKKQSKYDFGWSELPFIRDLMLSMKGFADVHYPRNVRGEEGFQWFSENERTSRDARTGKMPPNNGLSLPLMENPLRNL